ncbi:hypothetical protein SAY87_026651 [Trapa incisa]|uniref:Uncharacterized protein n=1 Tax=Trapa incisa TaxID=236973 RepID=A0AAN7H435_9MYRT|nr:hypothetical protein SAY87_026651 [Trapa incisa]
MAVKGAPSLVKALAVLAASLVLILLSSVWAVAGEEDQQQIIITTGGNASLWSYDGEDVGGYLTVAQEQPHLEGFEMAFSDLEVAVLRRSLATYASKLANAGNSNKAVCGRDKYGLYTSCTTSPSTNVGQHCGPFTGKCR